MKKQTLAGYVMIPAALTFWTAWFLMPDPGTTDAAHILAIVKQSRTAVLSSALVQIVSSVLYVIALFALAQSYAPQRKITFIGLVLFGIGAMGMCADAFFHLLAFYMTDNTVTIQQDVVQVMAFMQTGGVLVLIPLMLPFFIGSILLAIGLHKQGIISKLPANISIIALLVGPLSGIIAKTLFGYQGNMISLTILGLFAVAHILIGLKILPQAAKEQSLTANKA